MTLRSPYPDIYISDESFSKYMFDSLDRFRDSVALVDSENKNNKLTFSEVKIVSQKCACALANLGLQKGDVIATCISNSIFFPSLIIGIAHCGLIATTCNPNYCNEEIIKQFVNSCPKVVFVDARHISKMKKIAAEVPSIKKIFTLEKNNNPLCFHQILDKIDAVKEKLPNVKINPSSDVMLLPYSSGTTGLPKGVMLTHRNVVAYAEIFKLGILLSRKDVAYLSIPMFHITGCYTPITTLTQGVPLVVAKRFSTASFFDAVFEHKITYLIAVPPMVLALCNHSDLSDYDLSSLSSICCTAAPLPAVVANKVKQKYKVRVFQEWGLTEGELSSASLDCLAPVHSVGVCMPNTLLKVADVETGKSLPAKKCGELCGKGPQIMKGYFNNAEATKSAFDSDGWFRTGDIGFYDEHGYIYIIDRIKELIKCKGFQVAPAELEEILLRHPKVSDAAVVGKPDEECGEVPTAFVVLTDKDALTADEVHDFMKDKISSYKYCRGGIFFLSSIPKSPSGKILRRLLKLNLLKQMSRM